MLEGMLKIAPIATFRLGLNTTYSYNLDKEQSKKMLELSSALEELDDIQNIFTNCKISIN